MRELSYRAGLSVPCGHRAVRMKVGLLGQKDIEVYIEVLLRNTGANNLYPLFYLFSVLKPNFTQCSNLAIANCLGHRIRPDFPILHQEVNGSKLIYFDNASSSHKPNVVISTKKYYNESYNSNVHRANFFLSARATDEYELARQKVANFINAEAREIVFTGNATQGVNLVAYSWGLANLKSGDEIILSIAEHHSTITTWQMVCQKTGAVLNYVYLTENEVPDVGQYKAMISKKTKLVIVQHISNVLGSSLPVEEIVTWAHAVGAKVLVDGAQSVPHIPVDVKKLGADFLVASSHKMCGPTGIGFLYGKFELLWDMPPFLFGGAMIANVDLYESTYAEPPFRFEAGTPPICQAIGFGAAIDYHSVIGMQQIHDYEVKLSNHLYNTLCSVPNVRIYGPAPSQTVTRAPLFSFNVEGISDYDIAALLNQLHGVSISGGQHCTQQLHERALKITGSARASLHFYNTMEEIDDFGRALKDVIKILSSK